MKHPLVLIHGWGQSSHCWQGVLREHPAAQCLALPGHSGTPGAAADQWLMRLEEQLPQQAACLVGWSLGGEVAMQIALRHPERVRALVLVATTPCFVQRDDWAHGTAAANMRAFQRGCSRQPVQTLQGFEQSMWEGADTEPPHSPAPPPDHADLLAGLQLLQQWDLRPQLAEIRCPVAVIHGEADAVVPQAAAATLAASLPNVVQAEFLPRASHALPWTHAPRIAAMITAVQCVSATKRITFAY